MNLVAVFLYSMWHIFLPGESTPILVALKMIGTKKQSLLKIGLGLGLSNGFIIIVCLSLGVFFSATFERYATILSVVIRIMGILVFFVASAYILFRLKRYNEISKSNTISAQTSIIEKHPLKSGLLIGAIPSFADLGFLFIGTMIQPAKLYLAIIVIWLGVLVSFTLVCLILGAIPIELLKRKYSKCSQWLHIIAASTLIFMGFWLGYMLWKDYSYYL